MFTFAIIAGIVLVFALGEFLLGKLLDKGAPKPTKGHPDFLESLRPVNAFLFVFLWNAPLLIFLLIRGTHLSSSEVNSIMAVQAGLLALASVLVLVSKRVQRLIFRDGIALKHVREGKFALTLWICLGITWLLLYRA